MYYHFYTSLENAYKLSKIIEENLIGRSIAVWSKTNAQVSDIHISVDATTIKFEENYDNSYRISYRGE